MTPSENVAKQVDIDLGAIRAKTAASRREKRHRSDKKRLPKNVVTPDPDHVPDPARWLPKRSKKKRRHRKMGAGGSQGVDISSRKDLQYTKKEGPKTAGLGKR